MPKPAVLPMLPTMVLAAMALCVPATIAAARAVRKDVNGITLGMTADQILAAATFSCALNKRNDVSCEDPHDGSAYKVMMSGGHPSVALSVKRTFCSTQPPATVLAGLMKDYGVGKGAARPNPNGASFDISDAIQANLNSVGNGCKAARSYQFAIRDNSLMQMQGGAGAAGTRTDGFAEPSLKP